MKLIVVWMTVNWQGWCAFAFLESLSRLKTIQEVHHLTLCGLPHFLRGLFDNPFPIHLLPGWLCNIHLKFNLYLETLHIYLLLFIFHNEMNTVHIWDIFKILWPDNNQLNSLKTDPHSILFFNVKTILMNWLKLWHGGGGQYKHQIVTIVYIQSHFYIFFLLFSLIVQQQGMFV